MKTIEVPALNQLDEQSQSILEGVKQKIGKIPNLYVTIGYSSSSLKAMLEAETSLSHNSSFSGKEREAINLIVSEVNACEYCLAAHTVIGQMKGLSLEDTIAIRKAEVRDIKLNAIVLLAQSITNNKGKAEGAVLEKFFEAGYDEKALVELIALISLRTFTNYVYANSGIPVDFPAAPSI